MKMKTYKFFTTIFSSMVLLLAMSCSDATDIVQDGELNEAAAIKDVVDLQSALNSVYSSYGPDFGGNGSGDVIYFNAIFTDNLKSGVANNGQGSQAYGFLVDISGNSISEFLWPNRYLTIFRANIALNALNNLTIESTDLDEANHIKGQLLALRALAHFDLFQYFTSDYQNDAALSIINVDFIPTIADQFERNTVAETLAFIKADLNEAATLLDPNNSTSANPIFINNDFIDALKVNIALLEGDNSSTIMNLAESLLAKYPLANQTEYINIFSDDSNAEVIFKLSRVNGTNGIGDLFYFNQVDPDDAYLEASNELYNELSEVPNDIRFFTNIDSQSNFIATNDPDNLLLIGKYPGSGDGLQINDIKVMRSAEILLIKAEMEARNNMLVEAATSIQDLRTARVGTPQPLPVYTNLNDALVDILKERRKELCFEGQRFLDLKRLGGELNIGVDRLSVDCESFEAPCNLEANNFRFTLGIPQSELNGNRVITQNSGY